jgi:DNA-binding winged helix-turn-helix (wHTH) protein
VGGAVWSTDANLVCSHVFVSEDGLDGLVIERALGTSLNGNAGGRSLREASQRALTGMTAAFQLDWKGKTFRGSVAPLLGFEGDLIGTVGAAVPEDARMQQMGSQGFATKVFKSAPFVYADLVVVPGDMVVRKGDVRLKLSPTEFRLLMELIRRPNEALTREVLLREVWGHEFLGHSRLVDMAIQRLRAKIESDPQDPTLILTVRGIGYRLGGGG